MALSEGNVSLQMAVDLLAGLEHNALFLAYQPVFDLKAERPCGAGLSFSIEGRSVQSLQRCRVRCPQTAISNPLA